MDYIIPFENLDLGGSADTFQTLVAAILADTVGYKAALMELSVFPSDDTPLEKINALQLKRIDDVSAGSSGTGTAVTPVPMMSDQQASIITGRVDFTVEPTTYHTVPLWVAGEYEKWGIIKTWHDPDLTKHPCALRDQLLGLLASARDATPLILTGYLHMREF